MQNNVISIKITSLYVSQPSSVVFACKTANLGPELQVSMGPRPHLCFFCFQNSAFSTRIASLNGSQLSSVVLCIHNSDIMTRINSLYGSQTSHVVLSMQNNAISIRNTSLYWSQPSSVVFACKTEWLAPELLDSVCPRPHLSSCALKNKVISIRNTSLYGSHTLPAVLCMQNNMMGIRITSLYWSQPSSVVFACKTEWLAPELLDSVCRRPHLSSCAWKTWLASELLVSMVPSPHL